MPGQRPNLQIEKQLGIFAWAMWFVAFAVISAIVWPAPLRHSDCWNYYQPATDFWAGKNLYRFNRVTDGFLYLPQFAVLYTPFMRLGHPLGDIVWRGAGLSLLAAGLWRMSAALAPGRKWFIFALATAGTLPAAIASLRNGEANLHIAGMMLLAAVGLRARRWGWATFWLAGGLVVKPLMMVMLLLAGAMYRPMRARLTIALIIVAAAPFLFQSPHYVEPQYHDYARWMNLASQPQDLYCNIRGLLGKMGWTMSQPVLRITGFLAAMTALGLCLLAKRRRDESDAAIFLLGFAACYLMLCNPKTESNSYVILAPVVALPAAMLLAIEDRPRAAIGLYFLSFLLICDFWAYRPTENWLKPLTALIVAVLLVRQLFKDAGMEIDSEPSKAHQSAPFLSTAAPKIPIA